MAVDVAGIGAPRHRRFDAQHQNMKSVVMTLAKVPHHAAHRGLETASAREEKDGKKLYSTGTDDSSSLRAVHLDV